MMISVPVCGLMEALRPIGSRLATASGTGASTPGGCPTSSTSLDSTLQNNTVMQDPDVVGDLVSVDQANTTVVNREK